MTNEEKEYLKELLVNYEAKTRLAELKKRHPSGYMTKRQISEYFGYHNNSRWANAFTAPMTAYKEPSNSFKKYKITDVLIRLMSYEEYKEGDDGEED